MEIDQPLQPTLPISSLLSGHVIDRRTPKQKLIDRASKVMGKEKRVIAVRVAHLSQTDCDAFLKQCERARNFGAYMNWALKVRK